MAALRGCSQFKVVSLGMPRAARTAGRAGFEAVSEQARNACRELSAAARRQMRSPCTQSKSSQSLKDAYSVPALVAKRRRRAVEEPAERRWAESRASVKTLATCCRAKRVETQPRLRYRCLSRSRGVSH